MSTAESRYYDAVDERVALAEEEREASELAAEVEGLEQLARAQGKPKCPTCHQHRAASRLGSVVWCRSCDEPAVD